jgi:mono/diheme cytochrome c family protein
MKPKHAIAYALAALILAPHAFAQAAGNIVDGREAAEKLCARCHAIAGPGPSPEPAAPPFSRFHKTQPPEDLTAVFEGNRLAQHSAVEMPQFSFTREQIDDLLAYMRSLP